MRNYFNYYTEIEERFQQRRGSLLMLSTLQAGIPLQAVLRGIDDAFDKHEAKKAKGRARRINGLAWCAQAVMEATEQMREAAVGVERTEPRDAGMEQERVAAHLHEGADGLERASGLPAGAAELARETASRLRALAADTRATPPDTEALENTLRALEEKLLAMLTAMLPEAELAALRAQAAQEIAPYRRRMQALQIRQIEQQFLEKRLLERYALPRLSLFYMRSGE